MNLSVFISFILFHLTLIIGQSIPNDHFSYQSRKILYDAGEDWQSLTIFGPIRYNRKFEKELREFDLNNDINWKIGFDSQNNAYSLSGYIQFRYKKFYGYSYPAFINKTDKNYDSSLIRSQLINNKEKQSGFGFENNWIILQIGKGSESWGAGNDIHLALSQNSGPYDYFLLGSDYGYIRVRYIHGYLGNIDSNINRYITARGFEWTNQKSLIIGLSETVIYSGENRVMDIGYLNPISSHLEIESNNRLNINDGRHSNAVWQLHLDYLLKKNFRFSMNYLYDEFVLDSDIQVGKEHGKALAIRLAYTPIFTKKYLLILHSSLTYVGTPTFRHAVGTNNFVQSGKPLGWIRGSDGQEFCIGMNYFNNKNLLISFSSSFFQNGEETITNRIFEPYEDYLEGPFPSGKVTKGNDVKINIIYWWRKNFSLSNTFYFYKNHSLFDLKLSLPLFKLF